jgi:hypothetical protein
MNNRVAKQLRKIAKQLTNPGVPEDAVEARHQKKIVPDNWAEVEASQAEGYEGPPVKPDFDPYLTGTFVYVWGTTKNIYNQLKGEYKGKRIPIPAHVKRRIEEEEQENGKTQEAA